MEISKGIATLVLALAILTTTVQASELQYFDAKIDFWGEKNAKATPDAVPPIVVKRRDDGDFPWKTYLDPKNKEFFKEGDYTPPEPFMEIARDPSDENIKNWFEFMRRKNELAARLQTRMQEYLAKNEAPALAAQIGTSVLQPVPEKAPAPVAIDPSRFRIRMYFDSHCPHCKRMFAVLKQLKADGYEVEALQVDTGPVPEDEKVVPLGRADLKDLKSHGGSAVPYLLIADVKRKALLPGVQGYHEYEEVMELLRTASRS